ncbi:MAG: outer membrane lipoprotein carrier protein LolA [Alphaproteobacteria bacterium]|nr:MAG: outer membrane lipoprotein carrier protein LolA [Alphaproteobacteria bacterium]
MMKSVLFLIFTLVFSPSKTKAAKDVSAQKWVEKAEQYLNTHKQWQASFRQEKTGELPKTGIIWVTRPGLLRIDYQSPEIEHLYINNKWVTHVNPRFQELSNIPIDATPAAFFLSKHISLSANVRVTGTSCEGNEVVLRVVEKEDPNKGMVLLIFTQAPFAMKGWVIIDAGKNVTRITLTTPVVRHDKKHAWFIEETSSARVKLRD